MGTQDIQGYTGYTVLLGQTWVHRIYRGIQGIQYYWVNMGTQDIKGYKGYIGVYRVYSTTRVDMGKQDIPGYTRYTVLLE